MFGTFPEVCDANSKPLSTLATLNMPIRLGRYLSLLEFLFCEHLSAPLILGTDYCYRFVEWILPTTASTKFV